MVRIKYNQIDSLLYTDWFTLGPNFIVRGIINTETFTYQILELNSELVLEGRARNLREAKTIMKNKLSSIGVNFEGEIRSRK